MPPPGWRISFWNWHCAAIGRSGSALIFLEETLLLGHNLGRTFLMLRSPVTTWPLATRDPSLRFRMTGGLGRRRVKGKAATQQTVYKALRAIGEHERANTV